MAKKDLYTKLRETLGLTQDQLSGLLGISRSHLGMIEKGGRGLSPKIQDIVLEAMESIRQGETSWKKEKLKKEAIKPDKESILWAWQTLGLCKQNLKSALQQKKELQQQADDLARTAHLISGLQPESKLTPDQRATFMAWKKYQLRLKQVDQQKITAKQLVQLDLNIASLKSQVSLLQEYVKGSAPATVNRKQTVGRKEK
jgi:transcriptional regulator with XRE-family HTH domain